MQVRNKIVTLGKRRFQVRRLPVEVGSYIFMRMMGASMRASSIAAESAPPVPRQDAPVDSGPPAPKPTGEMQVRALAFSVLSGAMSFDDFKFVQNACLHVVSVVDEQASKAANTDIPMPIMTDAGQWTPQAVDFSDNVGLVMQLTTEVLVFCFSDFFEETSSGTQT